MKINIKSSSQPPCSERNKIKRSKSILMSKPKSKSKLKSSDFIMFSRYFRTLALCKRCRRFRRWRTSHQPQQSHDGGRSQSPPSPEKGPLLPCGTVKEQMSDGLNEQQLKEAHISARYALHKYSECDTEDKDIKFKRLVRANIAKFHEDESCYSYFLTIEDNSRGHYDAHVLYKREKPSRVEVFECFFIRPTIPSVTKEVSCR